MTPLYTGKVAEALARKGNEFETAEREIREDMVLLQEALEVMAHLSRQEIDALIAQIKRPGARPTDEQDSQPLIVPFAGNWPDHRQAREWALSTLAGVTTFAVDGSQIFPNRDMSVPVGLVQVGWFENPHDAAGTYTKDVQVEVLTPAELMESFEAGYAEREVEWRRFAGEIRRLKDFMEARQGSPALAFLDGSLILSFVHTMRESRQRDYIAQITGLLRCSEETGVPVIGYIDSSLAADLTSLLGHVAGYRGGRVGDATVLRRRMQWGDRTRWYVCSRDDEVADSAYYERVVFTYLKTTRDYPPARVEMPAWVFEQGRHEWVLDVVRAECVVGVGYPYPLETADAVAVLSMQDRERFYRMFQTFADERGIRVRFSRKLASKRGRRV